MSVCTDGRTTSAPVRMIASWSASLPATQRYVRTPQRVPIPSTIPVASDVRLNGIASANASVCVDV